MMALRHGTYKHLIVLISAGASLWLGPMAVAEEGGPAPAPAPAEESAKPPVRTLEDARDLLMTGAYEQATQGYTALAQEPRFRTEAGLGLARCRLRLGSYAEGLAGLVELDATDSVDWHCLLARLSTCVGDYEAALNHLRLAVAMDAQGAEARWLLGSMLEQLGRRAEAIDVYRWFERQVTQREELPRDAAWVTFTAQGFLRYSVLTQTNASKRTQHALNEMFQYAYGPLDRTYWPARIAAADLLREKFNHDEEDGSVSDYLAALRINPNLCEAHVGLGAVALEAWDFEEVERRAALALGVNERFAPARHLLGMKLVLERRYAQAIEACAEALQVNPNDVMALSISAAAHACQYDDAEVAALRARVERVNPKCATLHRTVATGLSRIFQYASSAKAYRAAIECDPTDANARTELGMVYMQWGEEHQAREALEAAWTLDPFNERTKFTLDLLKQLETYDRVESDHFIVRYDEARDPGLGRFVADYMEGIYEAMVDDYDATLEKKTIIEMFPTQRAFAVRITGKPWLQTVGACTGRVIAMASPRKDPELLGPYHIGNVLTHEFTHTVTLAVTHNRIPHWFTEGLAVLQENRPRPFDWCAALAEAARLGEVFTLESVNWGFIRPRRPGDRQRAYAQSELMCEFIIERFGYDAIDAMLDRFREGQTQRVVFVEQLGIEPERFDRDFQAWQTGEITRWGFDLSPPEDADELEALAEREGESAGVLGRLARAQFERRDNDAALETARRALALDERNRDGLEIAVKVLAQVARETGSEPEHRALADESLPLLERLMQVDRDGWTAPKLLATILLEREEWDRAIEPLKRLQLVCPMDPESWRGLAGIYMQRGEFDLALPQLLELARTEDHDASVPARLALIQRRKGKLKEAKHWYREALLVDPFDAELHADLGDTNMRIGDTRGALASYRMLTKIEPDEVGHFERAAIAAHKMGDREQALALARRAVELDPNSSARSLLP